MCLNRGIRCIAHIFLLMFLLLSFCLVYWQVVAAPAITAGVHNLRHCLLQNAPLRGRILDRNGVVLAQSIPDKTATCGYVRYYSEPSLAGVIGYYVPEYGLVGGIEKQYSAILDGTEDHVPLTDLVHQTLHSHYIGNDIYLTIDIRIQRLVNQYFTNYHPTTDPLYRRPFFRGMAYESRRGSVIVSNPRTGEILAMVSAPGYDPNRIVKTLAHGDLSYFNQINHDKDQPLLMRPLNARYAPGSVFKTVTLLAALDTGTTTLDRPWSRREAMGPLTYDGWPIRGDNLAYGVYTFHFPITTAYAYANSDNVVFARLGVSVGRERWLDYAHRFYIDRPVPFDLSAVKSSVQNQGQRPLSTLQLASNAFGQGIDDISPFQMSLIDNAVANNGVLMRPMLVARIVDKDDNPVLIASPQVLSTVVNNSTAYQVRQAMYGVATCGSAWRINKALGYTDAIIAKTGTAEIGDGAAPHSWMITQAPFWLDNPDTVPDITIVAMRENAGEGAYAVGPAIWSMYRDIFSHGYVKTDLPPLFLKNNPYQYCLQQGLWQTRSSS